MREDGYKQRGFVKLNRDFFKHWLWQSSEVKSSAEAYLDLLQMACYVPRKHQVQNRLVTLRRGELVLSERLVAERWEWSFHPF